MVIISVEITKRSYCNLKPAHKHKKNQGGNRIVKREEHIRMKYVNKLPRRERSFCLMAQHYNLALQGREKWASSSPPQPPPSNPGEWK